MNDASDTLGPVRDQSSDTDGGTAREPGIACRMSVRQPSRPVTCTAFERGSSNHYNRLRVRSVVRRGSL